MTLKLKICIWGIGLLLLVSFYYLVNPVESSWVPQCVFHRLTGWQCMGCGSQRMAHALLHGNFREAFEANALVFCLLPVIVFLTLVELNRRRFPRLYGVVHRRWLIISFATLLAAWLPVRNFFDL